ncbi:hypothetical protein E9993_09525 [Labilibacter sediminis]|nr:hypothetical protein E9993_09525 [Labilibacter sediminis]
MITHVNSYKRKYRNLVIVLCLLISINGFCQKADSSGSKPNIVLIYVDDMGFGDVGYNGANDVLTPNIDALANRGVIFNQGYVSASVCAPSRAGLLTGIYQQKFGLGENCSASGWPNSAISQGSGIPDRQIILPEILKDHGYHTGMVGKWHLGIAETKRPNAKGFDYFYGFLNGSHSYYKSDLVFGSKKGHWPVFENNKMVPFEGYLTDVFTEKATEFIQQSHDEPFFLYVAYNAVHHPWEVPDEYLERLSHIKLENRRKFAGMVLALDDGVGRIVETLKDKGISDNTVIIFISDNGSPSGQAKGGAEGDFMSSTGGLRGWKGDTYEGGIRVPFVINWPGVLLSGQKYPHPVSNLDILPTITSYLNIQLKYQVDGVNLLPYVQSNIDDVPHDVLYWRRDDDYAIRKGNWKLCWNDRGATTKGSAELYNLEEDPFEEVNLVTEFPELARELQVCFDMWDSKLPDSKWWGAPINRK